MKQADNKQWIKALKADHGETFRVVFDVYYLPVKRNIAKFIADAAVVEDILQDTFLALWEGRQKLAETVDLGGWLFSTSYYKSIAFLRKELKLSIVRNETFDENLSFEDERQNKEDAFLHKERFSRVREAIDALPRQKKQAVLLCKVNGESYENAARQMDISEATIRQYVKLSMAYLKDALNKKTF